MSGPNNTKVWAIVRLARPHFLSGGLLMFAVGAFGVGQMNIAHYVIGQAMVTSAQLTAHFANEYGDYEVDKLIENRTIFSGGSGLLGTGGVSSATALRCAQVMALVTVVLSIGVATFSTLAAIAGVCALIISWTYSMPPVRLLDTGWGEIATALTVAGLVPLIGALSQHRVVGSELVFVACLLCVLQFVMLLAFALPDIRTDESGGKRVLAVRLGRQRTVAIMGAGYVVVSVVAMTFAVVSDASWVVSIAVTIAMMFAGVTMFASRRANFAVMTSGAAATFFIAGVAALTSVA